MTPLPSQEFLEGLIARNQPNQTYDPIVIIKFGATWCGPCKRVDVPVLLGLSKDIKWYECDIDELDYTAGYCGVKTIPCFMAIVNGVPKPLYQNSDTTKIVEWIQNKFVQ